MIWNNSIAEVLRDVLGLLSFKYQIDIGGRQPKNVKPDARPPAQEWKKYAHFIIESSAEKFGCREKLPQRRRNLRVLRLLPRVHQGDVEDDAGESLHSLLLEHFLNISVSTSSRGPRSRREHILKRILKIM